MKSHTLHLHLVPFNKISSGKKKIESRLNDKKRREFNVGDELVFVSRVDNSEITATITALHYFPNFATLFQSIATEKFGELSSESLLNEIEELYSKEDQLKWGVVGIEFD
jgi:ASC-1-like (ASCH) protein